MNLFDETQEALAPKPEPKVSKKSNKRIDLEPQQVSVDVLLEKYAKNGETSLSAVRQRVARGLASVEEPEQRQLWQDKFFKAMDQLGMIPAGRINSAAGTSIQATLINCFVQPVGDSIDHVDDNQRPGIYPALQQAAVTMRRGGGVGYDFSSIRPAGAVVRGTASRASGPLSYMRVYDRSCETVESAGSRRGAQMGVLRIDHPDVIAFIHAKDHGDLANFNISVGVSDAFMQAVEADQMWDLVHSAEPDVDLIKAGAYRRDDGLWVYQRLPAREIWRQIMESTYDHAEPGILFLDHINRDNNLGYCEHLEATNPCAEQPLPPYGCCCLGSIDLSRHVRDPFSPKARFDEASFSEVVALAVRMLDNVLELSYWPLPQQHAESQAKRRVGLGFTGLGDALIMLGLKYDSDQAREQAAAISRLMRDQAYRASVALGQERGVFPAFEAEGYLRSGSFASRLPQDIQQLIREHGLRNSHLLSIAPTGTISLAFADNASNGIEPPYSLSYRRKKRNSDNTFTEYEVEDHAYRLFRALKPEQELPPSFVTALQMSAMDHMKMVAAVAPLIDTSISKTVNVPEDYPFEDFKNLYMEAWKAGLKGLATYRPNSVIGQVLLASSPEANVGANEEPQDRLVFDTSSHQHALKALRWPGRPELPAGAGGWVSDMVEHPEGSFAVFVSHTESASGQQVPFEVWVNGNEAPRALGAIAKTLSMDMRAEDSGWLRTKLEQLTRLGGEEAFDIKMPPEGTTTKVPSLAAAFARLLYWRCQHLGALSHKDEAPVLSSLFTLEEPKTGTVGTLSWTVNIRNPATRDDFVMNVIEGQIKGHGPRPYGIVLSGDYPRALDALARILSLDMRVLDVAWIGMKLKKLLSYAEPRGDFLAPVAGEERMQSWPSTIAYMAHLLIHRYARLGLLDTEGGPSQSAFSSPLRSHPIDRVVLASQSRGACPECGLKTLIKKDGCEFCTNCGYQGACG